ncbi:putative membrane protein YdjX (TVP38/TMEM64 family) [Litorimonas taeanensis]|uniref:TVP38/TMEM64 family membrane protein n=1 Tax=Litorimonas taeanensis TaxID=568099 RepID=A0A420WL16_9PROT|nr:VTT domain-containing protein [Litorimonas taeanensis]RKQ71669.1 putative membrane protein YdjX (TVP38/TMEM64 family) [Litorimonas taeanensis]
MKLSPSLIFTLIVSLILLFVLIGGLTGGAIDFKALESLMANLRDSNQAVFIVIAIFVMASFLGAPQWALITACVVGFGPVMGGIYAWVATLFSATSNYGVARLIGRNRLTKITGPRINKVLERVERNGVLWSFVVRLVPTGPFILVNLAAGISSIKYRSFLLGTALGIIPKILVMALIAKGIFAGLDKNVISLAFIALALIAIGLTFWMQSRIRNRDKVV